MKEKLDEIQEKLSRLKEKERERRIKESKLLSPEFDFLEIDDDGYLINPYPIIGSFNYTRDKVIAAGIVNGLRKMKDSNGEYGYLPYYEGRNEINERVHRKPIYSEERLLKEKKKGKHYDKH